ncbi:MAG: tRNA pseudouridine(55) synthase TruB [Longimicrobiales bacterium]
MAAADAITGVLPVDKPAGPTSHDMVARARHALRMRRIGHTGTLDPFATGLLLLCLGAATRLSEYLTGLPKRYSATLRLGVTTRTDDCTGEVVSTDDRWDQLDEDRILAALRSQTGSLLQVPPVYSAKKIEGERAYRLARKGADPDLAPVPVHVYTLEATRVQPPVVEFDVVCAAGTYIRAIARDVGERLGVGAHLTALRRTAIGTHRVEAAVPPERFDDGNAVGAALISPLRAVAHLARIDVDDAGRELLARGQPLTLTAGAPDGLVVASHGEELVAITHNAGGVLRPRKVFVHA